MVKFLGNTDEVTACDCCGRNDLKSTVALEREDGEVVHYGVVCAANALRLSAKEVRSEARKADHACAEAARIAHEQASREAFAAWESFLASKAGVRQCDGRIDIFGSCEKLGGYAAARAMFRAEQAKAA